MIRGEVNPGQNWAITDAIRCTTKPALKNNKETRIDYKQISVVQLTENASESGERHGEFKYNTRKIKR
jgi:hypothetical protein